MCGRFWYYCKSIFGFSENFESFATTNRCSNILKLNSEYAKEVCVIFIRLNRIIILSMSSKNHVKNDFPSAKIQLRFLSKETALKSQHFRPFGWEKFFSNIENRTSTYSVLVDSAMIINMRIIDKGQTPEKSIHGISGPGKNFGPIIHQSIIGYKSGKFTQNWFLPRRWNKSCTWISLLTCENCCWPLLMLIAGFWSNFSGDPELEETF